MLIFALSLPLENSPTLVMRTELLVLDLAGQSPTI